MSLKILSLCPDIFSLETEKSNVSITFLTTKRNPLVPWMPPHFIFLLCMITYCRRPEMARLDH